MSTTRPAHRRSSRTTRGRVTVLAAALAVAALPALATAAPAGATATAPAAATACSTAWGSLPKTSAPLATGRLTGVRAGHHACYDRLVVDMTGVAPGYDVRYVSQVHAEGSGAVVPVAGGARLAVVVKKGATSVPAMPSVAGYPTFRQVRWAGSFEGYTTIGLGVRARLPFRVFTVDDTATRTSRLVVDVAHTW
ncbi:hypothetical protein [Arthrobacter sp. NEB 688]|uniref:AMIN-like domain-containing (lipo)protein n=1 Tax=Arthrobacter sp. NEB 688 TaxID=904039 RepID=UPI001566E135|nr:hypothetical protein [Arthrobacter sp. NEB 688]QKE83609.1 hypothetical protein HL663_06420 [Arthrobacter sp. NEB 688]